MPSQSKYQGKGDNLVHLRSFQALLVAAPFDVMAEAVLSFHSNFALKSDGTDLSHGGFLFSVLLFCFNCSRTATFKLLLLFSSSPPHSSRQLHHPSTDSTLLRPPPARSLDSS